MALWPTVATHITVGQTMKQAVRQYGFRDWDEWVSWNGWRDARDHVDRDLIFSVAKNEIHPGSGSLVASIKF